MGAGGGGQVPTGREPQDADAGGIEVPRLGIAANRANRPLSVEQRHLRSTFWQAIFQHHAGDAMTIQPRGDAVSLGAGDQSAVAATGAYHDRRAVGFFWTMQGDPHFAFLKRTVSD